ncbi:MAG: HRDC domain-containing protein [Planctomycetes bacterium]|nr:HRDC domain-containing protein [Planctomycetota bacterium]
MSRTDSNRAAELGGVLVQTLEAFQEAVEHLRWEPLIAVDTEADAFFSYREKVCLIQFSTRERDFLVDPLAPLPFQELAPIFANPLQTKIFHDAEFDVLILKRDFGFVFRSIFDTRLACSLLGHERPGLANVLAERYGVKLDKSLQRSNWCLRPLSEEQLRYAREDTAHLIRLYEEVHEELEQSGRMQVEEAECRRLEALEPRSRIFDPAGWTKIQGARHLDPRGRRLMHELFAWRERTAEAADAAPFRIAPNELLLAIARQVAEGARPQDALGRLRGRLVHEHGAAIFETLRAALAAGPLEALPERQPARSGPGRLDERQQARYDALKHWRKERAIAMHMDAAYVLPRRALEFLAVEPARDLSELARVPEIDTWRVEKLGEEMLAVLASCAVGASSRAESPAPREGARTKGRKKSAAAPKKRASATRRTGVGSGMGDNPDADPLELPVQATASRSSRQRAPAS